MIMPRGTTRFRKPDEQTVIPVKRALEGSYPHTLRHSLPLGALRQHARLSIGVGGVAGGVMLLAANTMSILVGGGSFSLVPLLANAALVFGGVMFLRERRRAARVEGERATRSLAAG
jgi:hypothetical protein